MNVCISGVLVWGARERAGQATTIGGEHMAGGIDPRDYVRWVQRSLNRLLDAGIVVDGATTTAYHEWVTEFKWSRGLPADNVVDETTQNAFIKANHKEPVYVMWAQEALVDSGAGYDLKVDGIFGPKSKKCLQSFQAYNGLEDDGWLGAKSETKLIEVTGIYPPGEKRGDVPKPKPVPPKPPEPDWVDPMNLERRFQFWAWAYRDKLDKMTGVDEKQKKALICILDKLRLNRGWFDYIEAGPARLYVNSNKYDGQYPEDLSIDARQVLKNMTERIRTKAKTEKEGYQQWHKEFMLWYYHNFEKGLAEISALYSTQGYEKKAKALMNWVERMEKDSRSIIWCYYKHQPRPWW
jgi:hypothetical protein